MVLTVTEDTPADMLAGSMDLLVQLPREHHVHTQRVTVQRSTPMMDLLVQIATAHKLAASSYTLQAIGERGLVLPHQPNTPIGALDALQVKLLPKQGTFVPRKTRQANQPFETTFRLQVHLPRNQLYVSRVSPKMNLGEILEEVCREKNLDRNKYELRHPANLEEVLDLSLSLQDYHLQEVTLYAKQGRALGSALSSQDIMALQRQEERRRQQTRQGVFGFMFKKSKESSLSTDSLGGRSVSPARSDETGRSASPLAPPARPLRKRRPAPKPPVLENGEVSQDNSKEKIVISHSRNSSDSSGYHEASVLSDNPDSNTRIPETLPRRSKVPGSMDSPRKLAQTSQASKSLGNLAAASGGLSHGVSNTSLSSTGLRKKRTAPAPPPPPMARPLSSAISTQGLERIVDSEESLTSDMDISKPPSDIGAASSKANSDIDAHSNANSGVAMNSVNSRSTAIESKVNSETRLVPDVIPNCVKTFKTDSEMVEKTKPEPKTADKNIPKSNSEIVPAPSVPDTMNVATARVEKRDNEDGPMQTDVLLRKVSDTLSGSLVPPSQPSTMPPDSSCSSLSGSDEVQSAAKRNPVDILLSEATETLKETIESTKKIENAVKLSQVKIKQSNLSPAETILRSSTPNLTLSSSQQDTSDYVSAGGDDLSITDWEYQLPAPPSAFRDNDSPAFNDYETITLGSVEAFKEPIARIVDKTDAEKKNENNLTTNKTATKSSAVTSKAKHVKPVVDVTPPTVMDRKSFTRQISTESRGSDASLELKKEVISELENRIETGRLSQSNIKHSETDSRRASEISSTPTLAPVDNTLSNFTITTYSGQRSLNIFDEAEQQQQQQQSDEKTVKSFATLNRSRTISENSNGSIQSPRSSTARERDFAQTKTLPANGYDGQESLEQTEFLKPVPKSLKHESLPSSQSFGNDDEKSSNVHKSKSYISWVNNTKVRTEISGEQDSMNSMTYDSIDNSGEPIRKSVSINNLSQDTSRGNEKFSQWRENILKRQEEPTKEKQLQSLQVLKSILPKLKNSQQTDENVIEQSRNKVADEQITKVVSSIEHSTESSVNSSTADSKSKAESEMQKVRTEESSGKRFSYSGPPAISLGSWSERPCVNVQIKMDTDYKFGKSNTSGAKTVVNLNGTRDEADYVKFNGDAGSTLPRKVVKSNFIENEMSTEVKKSENKEKEELAKKLITHTTPSGFKRPALNKIGFPESRMVLNNEDKPVVTAMELKKTDADKNDPPRNQKQQEDDDDDIDTRPVKFEELTKAFGQEVTRRAKPKHIVQNRHSDYYGSKPEIITNFIKSDINQNGFAHSNKVAPKQVEPVRNNSVVSNGINNDAQNIPIKKYTSVIGINSQGAHFANQNGNFAMKNRSSSVKINGPMPVVKGFKIQASESEPKAITAPAKQNGFSVVNGPKKLSQTPQPPTMPVITGVTLKSNNARPKSMPLQKDSRDDLLESIRNFGGRDKLKTATGRRY